MNLTPAQVALGYRVSFLCKEYSNFITVIDTMHRMTEKEFVNFFNVEKDSEDTDKYRRNVLNPLRYSKVPDALKDVRDQVITAIFFLFDEAYPNVDLPSDTFEHCIPTILNEYEHEEKGLVINQRDVLATIMDKAEHADELALENLMEHTRRIIPYSLLPSRYGNEKKEPFTKDKILKGKRIELYTGWSYSYPNREHVPYFLRLVNHILTGAAPSTCDLYEKVYLKHYKNGRFDVTFMNVEDADKVATYIMNHQTRSVREA